MTTVHVSAKTNGCSLFSETQLHQNILASDELNFPSEIEADLCPDCIDLCRRLLHRDPSESAVALYFLLVRSRRVLTDLSYVAVLVGHFLFYAIKLKWISHLLVLNVWSLPIG
jgi:hypothetical protein